MDGVTILNVIEVIEVVNDTFNNCAGLISLALTVLIITVIGFLIGKRSLKEWCGAFTGCVVGLVISIFTSVIFGGVVFAHEPIKETHYYYEVTVDDSVSLTKFYEYYNVIEQRDKIFVVEEKPHE